MDIKEKVYIGIGANLSAQGYGTPREGCLAALSYLEESEALEVTALSAWYKTEPVPPSEQDWYQNAVCEVKTSLTPLELLKTLHECEAHFGRKRAERNEPRVLDLDLLDYAGMVYSEEAITLPHPRMTQRLFVLRPLADIAPDWIHPKSGESLQVLLGRIKGSGEVLRD